MNGDAVRPLLTLEEAGAVVLVIAAATICLVVLWSTGATTYCRVLKERNNMVTMFGNLVGALRSGSSDETKSKSTERKDGE